MSVLPGQKLTIGELYVSMAVGLILFLLPIDLKNQIGVNALTVVVVAVLALFITAALYLAIRRFEAIGAAILTKSVITVISFLFSILNGVLSKSSDYWPTISDYQLITMFILWTVPFLLAVCVRLFTVGKRDASDYRIGFARFLSLSLRALLFIYIMVLIFKQIMPYKPNVITTRTIYYMPFSKISDCINGVNGGSMAYLVWHCLILLPLTFSLLVLNPHIKWRYLFIVSLAAGLAIEILQFTLNTGIVYTDDLIMYMVGGFLGVLLKKLLDRIRRAVTAGEETTMLSLEYIPPVAESEETEEASPTKAETETETDSSAE